METSDGPLVRSLATDLAAGLEHVAWLIRSLTPPGELSLAAAATLATLERSGPCRLSMLAASQGVTQPGMTQLIARMKEAGLVEQAPDPDDGRAVRLNITAAGRTLLSCRLAMRAERLVGLLTQLRLDDQAALAAALPAIEALADAAPTRGQVLTGSPRAPRLGLRLADERHPMER
jgi:DNA-binding MarR family transcriptional regulator